MLLTLDQDIMLYTTIPRYIYIHTQHTHTYTYTSESRQYAAHPRPEYHAVYYHTQIYIYIHNIHIHTPWTRISCCILPYLDIYVHTYTSTYLHTQTNFVDRYINIKTIYLQGSLTIFSRKTSHYYPSTPSPPVSPLCSVYIDGFYI